MQFQQIHFMLQSLQLKKFVTLFYSQLWVKQYVFIYIGTPSIFILLPLNCPIFSYKFRTSLLMIKVAGILAILAFIQEHTFSKNGNMEQNGDIGDNLMVDLNVFLLDNTTSIWVARCMISGDMTGLGIALMIVICNYLMISSLFLILTDPKSNFFSYISFIEVYSSSIYCLYFNNDSLQHSIIDYIIIYCTFQIGYISLFQPYLSYFYLDIFQNTLFKYFSFSLNFSSSTIFFNVLKWQFLKTSSLKSLSYWLQNGQRWCLATDYYMQCLQQTCPQRVIQQSLIGLRQIVH